MNKPCDDFSSYSPILVPNGLSIYLSKHAGFCTGVRNAVDKAMNVEGKASVLGSIIHNESVIKALKERGVVEICEPIECKTDTVIISAHGAGKAVYECFEKTGISIIDTTCGFVRRIQRIVSEHHEKGYQIIIAGDASHAEVRGINGWCDFNAKIIAGAGGLDIIDFDKPTCIVSQTTFSLIEWKDIRKKLDNPHYKTVVVYDTICYTTYDRQTEAEVLSQNCPIMFVLGSKSSSNTRKLYEICSRNCANTYLICEVKDADHVNIDAFGAAGIVAGASASNSYVQEFISYLRQRKIQQPQ